jgi:hypothetical protein
VIIILAYIRLVKYLVSDTGIVIINLTNEMIEENIPLFGKGVIFAIAIIIGASIISAVALFGNPTAAHAQTADQRLYNSHGIHIRLPGNLAILNEGSDGIGGTLVMTEFQSTDPELGMTADGAVMKVDIIPNPSYPIPFNNQHFNNLGQCTEVKRNIATLNQSTNALHISTQCNAYDSDVFMEDLWVAASDKVVHIQYQALEDFTYNLHASEFISSVATLTVDGSVDINSVAP